MAEGVCSSIDPDLWFPGKSESSRPAKRFCNGFGGRPPCPVVDLCLDYALRHDERFGVWGGKSERERARLKGRRPKRY